MSYVQESNAIIGGFEAIAEETPKKKPKIAIAPKTTPIPIVEDIEQEQHFEPIVEEQEDEYIEEVETITEDFQSSNEMLIETFSRMKDFLIEQQQAQVMMSNTMMELVETVKAQNLFIQQKFDQLDEAAMVTANTLRETSEKLESLIVRDLNIPAPIVNVSLSEQKKIVKTVDRDENGLIKKITEEIQQSVSEDK